MKKSFAIFFISSCLFACASSWTNPLLSQSSDAHYSAKEIKALSKKTKALWSNRQDFVSLNNFVDEQSKIALSSYAKADDLCLMSRAHLLIADYFTDQEAQKINHWKTASQWAEKALATNSAFKEKVLNQKIPPEYALDTLKSDNAEALYYFALSLNRWASTQGVSTALQYKDRVNKMMDLVIRLDASVADGGAYRYYGSHYAQLPGFSPEDLKLSKKYFETALKRFPEFYANHVQFAEVYAKKVDDSSLFKRQLEYVVQATSHRQKESYPEQVLEQKRAKKLLEGIQP